MSHDKWDNSPLLIPGSLVDSPDIHVAITITAFLAEFMTVSRSNDANLDPIARVMDVMMSFAVPGSHADIYLRTCGGTE